MQHHDGSASSYGFIREHSMREDRAVFRVMVDVFRSSLQCNIEDQRIGTDERAAQNYVLGMEGVDQIG
ncbi:hypothetical protein D3C75_1207800 [compost metagenome]